MPKYQAELLYPEDFDELLNLNPKQIWFVDRPSEYVAALAHTAGRQMDTQLIEFQTHAFDPAGTAVIADDDDPGDIHADPIVYPWVCRYPGVWVLAGRVFLQHDEYFMTMVTVAADGPQFVPDDEPVVHPDPQLIKIPVPPKMDYTNIDLCMYAYDTGDGWELGWGYKSDHGFIEPLVDHPDFKGSYDDALIDWPFREDDWVDAKDLRSFGFGIV